MRAVTTSGVVVMNLLPPGASFWGGHTHFTPLSLPSSLPGIEQSLSVRATEAENIYEDPDCVRQVTNLDAFKWPLMTFGTLSFLPLSPLHRFSPPLVLCAPLCFFSPSALPLFVSACNFFHSLHLSSISLPVLFVVH